MNTHDQSLCPLYHQAVEIIGRRWTGAILLVMLQGATRFRELRQTIPDISDKMLSERLKELELEGILTRTVIPETPVRIEYRLTEKGQALKSVIAGISTWASEWLLHQETVT
ncbi:MAG: helix-turn-helix transcriptional regulator [Deinococcota bacterium]|jgi:DNA-binding HxlR family transcriptional regulator|nr:helix-turn-helix transcriptional regulator [Deinococcota bacterium]